MRRFRSGVSGHRRRETCPGPVGSRRRLGSPAVSTASSLRNSGSPARCWSCSHCRAYPGGSTNGGARRLRGTGHGGTQHGFEEQTPPGPCLARAPLLLDERFNAKLHVPVARIAHGENHLAIAEVGQCVQPPRISPRSADGRCCRLSAPSAALLALSRSAAPTSRLRTSSAGSAPF
jgi:hypothetical protein